MAYSAIQYDTAVKATVEILRRAGVDVSASDFGTRLTVAYNNAPSITRSAIDQTVKALTGGTVVDLAATRDSKRDATSFKKVSYDEILGVLRPAIKKAISLMVPSENLANDLSAQLDRAVDSSLIRRESGGVVNISWRNPAGGATDSNGRVMTASGPFQYIMATWNAYASKIGFGTVYRDPLQYRSDTYRMIPGSPGDLQTACAIHAAAIVEHALALSRARLPINNETLYFCHFVGTSAAIRMMKSRSVDTVALRLDVNPGGLKIAQRAIATLAA